MVATVRNLTSASATSEYFQRDGGYYLPAGGDREELRAKRAEHRNASAWHGRGASALGLRPGRRVSATLFEALLQGCVPGRDLRLGRRRDGRHEHRPGFDITLSAPKSVSLAALLPTRKHPRGDRAVLRAHDEAVRATLDWVEATFLETRGWDPSTGKRPRVRAPWMVAATFRHIASRNLDPQLHTHAVVANMTRDARGRWKSVEPTLLHRNARLIGAYYRNELARRLIARGYSILPAMAGRIPSFEIAGYNRRVRERFSTRRRDVLAYVERRGLEYTQASTQIAALATRARKAEPVRAALQGVWADRARALGLDTLATVSRARGEVSLPPAPSALEIVGRAVRQLEERQSVFSASALEALALGHSPGRHSIEAIRDAVEWMIRDAHLVEAKLSRSDRAFVTDWALRAERSVIAMMRSGLGAGTPLAREEEVAAHLAGAGLTEGQGDAVRTALLARDRIVGVQGRAGTGKTTMLRYVRALAGDRSVLGLAPSASAAGVLARETGLHARTLQWFLARFGAADNGPGSEGLRQRFAGSVVVLDEASMVSTDQMRSLMRIAHDLDLARLVLVGDRSQLRAVEAGQPFRLLQEAGMTTATMDDIRRQRRPELRAAVRAVLAGEPGEAVEILGGSVHEVPYEELGEKAAQAWLELHPVVRERTLLVAPTHALRAEIDRTVREALAAEGVLRGRALRIERLVSLGMTRAEKGDVRNYREGDTVVFHQDLVNYRLKRDEVLTVTGVDAQRVHLLHPDGKARNIKPGSSIRYRLEVYETRPIEIRAGDRIRWTRNDRARALVNGERAEVASVARNRVRLRLADGRALSLRSDDPQLRHIDHAWSSTVHGAQGRTADGVIAVLDSGHGALSDQSTFYVELSRARERVVVLTDNREQLVEVLEANTGERASALEAVGERVGPAVEALARRVPEKAPVWTLREGWSALEARARSEGTVLFGVEGYGTLLERARALARAPDTPAGEREVAEGLLAYDRACRKTGAAAEEFLGLLDAHRATRRELERAAGAGACPVAELDGYGAWRDRAGRLSSNGRALLEEWGERAGDAGRALVERLGRLSESLALDDSVLAFESLRRALDERARAVGTIAFHVEGHDGLLERARALEALAELPAHTRAAVEAVIADAEVGERRWRALAALRAEAAALLDERRGLGERAGGEPPAVLDEYRAWSARCENAAGRWRRLLEDPGAWRPHLDRLGDEAAELEAAFDRLADLRGHDRAWAALFAGRRSLMEEARAAGRIAFYLGGWDAFVGEAREFAERGGLPDGAERAARRVLEYDRGCRDARAAVERFLEDTQTHRERRDALREEGKRRARRDPRFSMTDLPECRALFELARQLRAMGGTLRRDERKYGPHVDQLRDGRSRLASALEWLDRVDPLERFVDVMDRLSKTARDARERNTLPFHDDGYRGIIAEAQRLARERALEAAARRRLQAVLDEHAARAREWRGVRRLLREMEGLEREFGELGERAAREGVLRPRLPEWPEWLERNRRIEASARSALADHGLEGHWRSRPEIRARVEEGIERARERERLPEREADRNPDRGEALALWRAVSEAHFPLRCKRDIVVGDLLRWTEEPEAVVLVGGLVGRTAAPVELDDQCVVEVYWRSDGAACGHAELALRTLVSGRCSRAFWEDEEERRREADERKWELDEKRERLLRSERYWSMKLSR